MRRKKIQLTDTVKNITHDPKDAMKDDYEQTKADMMNIKGKVTGDGKKRSRRGRK